MSSIEIERPGLVQDLSMFKEKENKTCTDSSASVEILSCAGACEAVK